MMFFINFLFVLQVLSSLIVFATFKYASEDTMNKVDAAILKDKIALSVEEEEEVLATTKAKFSTYLAIPFLLAVIFFIFAKIFKGDK